MTGQPQGPARRAGQDPDVRAGAPDPHARDPNAARSRAGRVFVTAHPAEPPTSVALRAGEAALGSCLDAVPSGGAPVGIAVEPLRRLFARHLADRLPPGPVGELHAAVTAAAVVAALDLALGEWVAAGARADAVPACRERFRAVAPLLPEPGRTRPDPPGRHPGAAGTAPGRRPRRSPLA